MGAVCAVTDGRATRPGKHSPSGGDCPQEPGSRAQALSCTAAARVRGTVPSWGPPVRSCHLLRFSTRPGAVLPTRYTVSPEDTATHVGTTTPLDGWGDRALRTFLLGPGSCKRPCFSYKTSLQSLLQQLWSALRFQASGFPYRSSLVVVQGSSVLGFYPFSSFWNFTMIGHCPTDHPTAGQPDDSWSSVGC